MVEKHRYGEEGPTPATGGATGRPHVEVPVPPPPDPRLMDTMGGGGGGPFVEQRRALDAEFMGWTPAIKLWFAWLGVGATLGAFVRVLVF